MPYDVSVEDAARIIVVRGYGDGTTADTLQLISDLTDTLRRCGGYDLIYDSTELRIQSSPADMMTVADGLFGEAGAVLRRFAIVVPAERVQLARIFVALADPFGVTADVFCDMASARDWLSAQPDRPVPGQRVARRPDSRPE